MGHNCHRTSEHASSFHTSTCVFHVSALTHYVCVCVCECVCVCVCVRACVCVIAADVSPPHRDSRPSSSSATPTVTSSLSMLRDYSRRAWPLIPWAGPHRGLSCDWPPYSRRWIMGGTWSSQPGRYGTSE